MHLHGQSAGGGKLQLTADQVVAQLDNQQIAAQGLNTGEVDVSSRGGATTVQFSSFSLRDLRWNALPKK
jgi:hypothetical protein